MIFLFIKTISKANDMEIFVEKSFSVIIKKYNTQARLLYMMNLLYFLTVRQIGIYVHLRLLFKL